VTGPHVRAVPRLARALAGNSGLMPARKDMPSTLKRSPKKAQDTYAETHDSAV
jgi:hypothetical protein